LTTKKSWEYSNKQDFENLRIGEEEKKNVTYFCHAARMKMAENRILPMKEIKPMVAYLPSSLSQARLPLA
jgi:hypothetical protein